MEEEKIREWKAKEFMQISSDKISKLEVECESIRDQEIAFAREPLVSSVSSVSIPVLNYKKNLLGAVTVVGFTEFIPQNENNELARYLVAISKEISGSFGYRSKVF
jgi:DNA-binding IclR family transcriptional regulator